MTGYFTPSGGDGKRRTAAGQRCRVSSGFDRCPTSSRRQRVEEADPLHWFWDDS